MTKLEEKLIELGYETNCYDKDMCEKEYVKIVECATLYFYIPQSHHFYGMCVANNKVINQNIIDKLQQAFNQLQQDLEVLISVN